MKKQMSVSQKMNNAQEIAEKIAKIMNEAKAKAQKLTLPLGYDINVQIEFLKKEVENV
jgi:5-formyltetrahydrofolate cyclo-ligase